MSSEIFILQKERPESSILSRAVQEEQLSLFSGRHGFPNALPSKLLELPSPWPTDDFKSYLTHKYCLTDCLFVIYIHFAPQKKNLTMKWNLTLMPSSSPKQVQFWMGNYIKTVWYWVFLNSMSQKITYNMISFLLNVRLKLIKNTHIIWENTEK